jgi:hypothetical protein
MMFGKQQGVPAPVPNKTMVFGASAAVAPTGPVPTFGADESGDESAPRSESTVRVDLEHIMREHGKAVEQRDDRTQRFSVSESDASVTLSDGPQSVKSRHGRTALFAMSSLQETTEPDAFASRSASEPNGVVEPTVSVDLSQALPLDGHSTLPPDANFGNLMGLDRTADPEGASSLMEPGEFSTRGTMPHESPAASTLPNIVPVVRDSTSPGGLRLAELGDGVEAIAAQGRRRNVVAIVVVLLIVLAVGLGVAWQFLGEKLLSSEVDPESQQTVVQALQHFQREDVVVREADIARLQSLVRTNATFTDGHAALVLGLTLQIDDLRGLHAALVSTHARLSREHETLKRDPTKEAATQALGRRINALVERAKSLAAEIVEAWARLDAAVKTMDGVVAQGAPAAHSQRSRVFAAAQQGRLVDDTSEESSSDYWLQLAPPLAVLNAKSQSPSELNDALRQVEAVKERFADLPRPHFIAARLYVALGQTAKAIPELERAIELAANFRAATETKKALEEK